MKKNKNYWKKQAKAWRKIAEMETESANDWSAKYYYLNMEYEDLDAKHVDLINKYEAVKRELNTLRLYNIGRKTNTNKSNTTGTSGSGYSYNTTFDFTQPKKKKRWRRS
jgi:hypothetical protein